MGGPSVDPRGPRRSLRPCALSEPHLRLRAHRDPSSEHPKGPHEGGGQDHLGILVIGCKRSLDLGRPPRSNRLELEVHQGSSQHRRQSGCRRVESGVLARWSRPLQVRRRQHRRVSLCRVERAPSPSGNELHRRNPGPIVRPGGSQAHDPRSSRLPLLDIGQLLTSSQRRRHRPRLARHRE